MAEQGLDSWLLPYDSPIGTLLRPLPKHVSLPSCYSQGLAHDGEEEYTFSIIPSNSLFPA